MSLATLAPFTRASFSLRISHVSLYCAKTSTLGLSPEEMTRDTRPITWEIFGCPTLLLSAMCQACRYPLSAVSSRSALDAPGASASAFTLDRNFLSWGIPCVSASSMA